MSEPGDPLLTRYLLGQLEEEEIERLDERSITDDSFASQLEAAENDLIDAFLHGELSGESLERFKRVFSAPARLRKIEFAKALMQVSENVGLAQQPAPWRTRDQAWATRSIWAWFTSPQPRLQWTFAAAALLLLFGAGYLLKVNRDLREQAGAARQQEAQLNQRTQELERQLNEHRAATGASSQPPESTESTAAPLPTTVAVLLLPQARGVGQVPKVSIPARADLLNLQLQLEMDDFPAYRVALKDPSSGGILWTSAKLKSASASNARVVKLSLPSRFLKPQTYVLELNGFAPGGTSQFISSYVFKAVIE